LLHRLPASVQTLLVFDPWIQRPPSIG
jgi:hypothetical protein